MPQLGNLDPLFSDNIYVILKALGTIRATRPSIDLLAICRFEAPGLNLFVSEIGPDDRMFGVQVFDDAPPLVGYFHQADLILLKRSGRLYRGDLINNQKTITELANIARSRTSQMAA